MKFQLFAVAITVFMMSCQPKSFVGIYRLKYFPKTSIMLKDDNTFEFLKINPNPYLHPFDHPEDDYFLTRGTWQVENGQLTLNSCHESDSSFTPEVISSEILEDHIDSRWKRSRVAFVDVFNDTVNVLYAKFPDGSVIAALHRSMKFVDWPVTPGPFDEFAVSSDTIEFHFYGYQPYTFIRHDKTSRNVKVRLYPKIKGSVFVNKRFKISRHAIKDGRLVFRE